MGGKKLKDVLYKGFHFTLANSQRNVWKDLVEKHTKYASDTYIPKLNAEVPRRSQSDAFFMRRKQIADLLRRLLLTQQRKINLSKDSKYHTKLEEKKSRESLLR